MDGQKRWFSWLPNILVKGGSLENLLVATKCFNPMLFIVKTFGGRKEMQALVGHLKNVSYFASKLFLWNGWVGE